MKVKSMNKDENFNNKWLVKLTDSFQTLNDFFNRDNDLSPSEKENFKNSPSRVAKAIMEMTLTRTEIIRDVEWIISTIFPTENDEDYVAGLIVQGPIYMDSICPHHWLPVSYEAYVGYLPKVGEGVLGLSKLARLSMIMAKRPVLQEQLTRDIAHVLHTNAEKSGQHGWPSIVSEGSAVTLTGEHSCMRCRGVRSRALTVTSEMTGQFLGSRGLEEKFNKLTEYSRNSKLG